MPRRADITPRELEADPVHGSKLVTQFINAVMLDGKRSTAERLVYDALAIVAEKTGKAPVLTGCVIPCVSMQAHGMRALKDSSKPYLASLTTPWLLNLFRQLADKLASSR
jgi:hypothetical protein